MEKVSITNQQSYADEFQKFTTSKLFNRLQEKFRVKPYHEENKSLRIVVLLSSYLFNFLSITTGFLFMFSLFNLALGWIVAVPLSISLLIVLECLKRQITQPIFKNYFQFKTRSYLRTVVAVGLVVLSAFLSYQGGDSITRLASTNIQLEADSLELHYSRMIADRMEQQKQLSKVKYKGTTTRTAQKGINALQDEINVLRTELSKHSDTRRQEQLQENTQRNKQLSFYGLVLSLVALFFDLSLVLCLAYLEYYDYRSYSEFASLDDSDTATVQTLGGGVKPLESKEVKEIAKKATKNCLNCSSPFPDVNPNKKYCSTTCRVKHWEVRNKKKLTVPTT